MHHEGLFSAWWIYPILIMTSWCRQLQLQLRNINRHTSDRIVITVTSQSWHLRSRSEALQVVAMICTPVFECYKGCWLQHCNVAAVEDRSRSDRSGGLRILGSSRALGPRGENGCNRYCSERRGTRIEKIQK